MSTYRTFVPYDNSVAANQVKWGQSFGQALSNFGWVAQSGHGETVATLSGGLWTWTTTPSTPTGATATLRVLVNFRGAWSSGNSYAANDTVTNAGLTWMAIATIAGGGSAPTSGASWQPYNFEIWASAGPMTSSLPLFLKLVYGNGATNVPALHIQVGTGVDSNGNLTGAPNLMDSSPLSVGIWSPGGSLNTASVYSMDFSGDSDNFRMVPWRNIIAQGATASQTGPPVLVIDRAKTASGADADGYTYIGWLANSASATFKSLSSIILKPTIGGIVAQSTTGAWLGAIVSQTSTLGNWGSSPPMPIFPLVGYTANPLLGAIAVQATDWQNGSIIPVWIYGAVHYFLVCGTDTTASTYRALLSGGAAIPAIRWE